MPWEFDMLGLTYGSASRGACADRAEAGDSLSAAAAPPVALSHGFALAEPLRCRRRVVALRHLLRTGQRPRAERGRGAATRRGQGPALSTPGTHREP